MLPYFSQPEFHAGSVTISAFGVLLISGILTGRVILMRRARRLGIGRESLLAFWIAMLLGGFAGAFVLKPLLIGMPGLLTHPLSMLHREQGLWSFGALCGGLTGGILCCLAYGFSARRTLALLDCVAYAAPFASLIARLGCALAHDHQGFRTASWIAVHFPGGPRYDLGVIEFLFLAPFAAAFYFLGRRARPAGFFFGLYGVVYGGFRIWLDTLHPEPMRFIGGGAMCLVGLAGWAAMLRFRKRKNIHTDRSSEFSTEVEIDAIHA